MQDLELLRHDKPLNTARKLPHLAHVPTYLKPESEGATASVAAVGSSARRLKSGKGRKLYGGKRAKDKAKKDPLRNFQGGKKGKKRMSKRK